MQSPFDPNPPLRPLIGGNLLSNLTPPIQSTPIRRTVFISHSHLHESETKQFLKEFGTVFIPRAVGVTDKDNFINSNNPENIMRAIREKHIGPASIVTIVLVGSCTHSRRYVDWEIKASLQQGLGKLPNGVLLAGSQNRPGMGT